jgi:hypothetical protein
MTKIYKTFDEWYANKCFTVLEGMKKEYHREYYCRSAWFSRDDEIDKLKERIKWLEESNTSLEKDNDKLWNEIGAYR